MEVSGALSAAFLQNTNKLPSELKSGDVSKVTASFSEMLEHALNTVDQQEKEVHALNEQFITGQVSDVHSVMIAAERAQLGLQLTVQVRNKVIEAYQEIMRTQL